jgi:hypothetical protein
LERLEAISQPAALEVDSGRCDASPADPPQLQFDFQPTLPKTACRIYSRLMKEYISQTMTMVVGQGSEQVEISVREVMPVDSPVPGDRHVDVSVVCRHFRARNCGAWISAPDWTRFGHELRALDKSRRGEALLVSQSPADLRLRLYAWDQAGHIAVEGHVGAYHTVADGMREVTLSFAFEIDKAPG